ncbi:MAG: methyltransferase domain-containing protein [Acidobacteriota bacterium]|nr:methyltransferase domain-containing protein [Acidobacteriota bacterium]
MFNKLLKKQRRQSPGDNNLHPLDQLSDNEFLDYIYKRFLGREPDPVGRENQLKFLREGNSRAALVVNITEAPEFIFKIVKDNIHNYIKLIPIKDERPENYIILADLSGREKSSFFIAESPGDFDWLERKILSNGYYERPGVWSFLIDEDKRMMADITAEFEPSSVLDFGCANGAVLKCLKDRGIDGDGVEISVISLDKAFPEISSRIRLGDIRHLTFSHSYDVILGLDIFEHLNPNSLLSYIRRLYELLNDGGFLYANIPAFGKDSVFGEIFRIDYESWAEDAEKKRLFRAVPVDGYGYPKNGHLIGATTDWWVDRFAEAGFRRETDIESALHRKFDEAMEKISPARRAYYVFSKNAEFGKIRSILDRIASSE